MKEFRAKVFRSGNSVALRLPAALKLAEGEEVAILSHRDGSYSFWRESEGKERFLALSGAMSPDFMALGRDGGEQLERDWRAASARAA